MADFTTGVIDLSIENTFDNVVMGATDTMTFSNAGTGGAAGKPIIVNGDFTTVSGAVMNLRSGVNNSPGTVTIGGVSRDLDKAADAPTGAAGTGGAALDGGSDTAGGGDGGTTGDGIDGDDVPGGYSVLGGAGGTFSGGNGGNGQNSTGVGTNRGAGGGGGAGATTGTSVENVSFLVYGTITIASGTIINGLGGNGADGGIGGQGGAAFGSAPTSQGGGGGGGGAGSGGGHAGNIYLFSPNTGAEAATKNLSGGSAGGGGAGGNGGGGLYPGNAGTAGGDGTDGTDGAVELISVSISPAMGVLTVTDIFSTNAIANASVPNNGGEAITERGVCYSTSTAPTTADTTITSTGTTGSFSVSITSLSEDTTYFVRAYAINSNGTSYSNEVEFKTHKNFVPTAVFGGQPFSVI